jgi:hypothetical protein
MITLSDGFTKHTFELSPGIVRGFQIPIFSKVLLHDWIPSPRDRSQIWIVEVETLPDNPESVINDP